MIASAFCAIALRMGLSLSTLGVWSKKNQWENDRREYVDAALNFSDELYGFIVQMTRDIRKDYVDYNKHIDRDKTKLLQILVMQIKDVILLDIERKKLKTIQKNMIEIPENVRKIPDVQEAIETINKVIESCNKSAQ